MADPFEELAGLLKSVAVNLDRLATAMEKQNEFGQKLMRCPRCLGDGKDYGSDRKCVGCGGTGVRQ